MKLEIASLKAMQYSCKNFHYSKSTPVNPFGFSVFNDKNEWCGCILYGLGANNNIAKQFNLANGQVIELLRMSLNGKQESTSKAMSISIKLVKKYLPNCKLLVSYADIDQDHIGTIYQATNWYYIGSSIVNKKDGSMLINKKRIHGRLISDKCKRYGLSKNLENVKKVYNTDDVIEYMTKGKYKYIYPIDKSLKSLCESLKKPYPKKSVENIYGDVNSYQS